jgi:hypothetical protein
MSLMRRLFGMPEGEGEDDERTIARMAQSGVDLSRPVSIACVLAFPEERAARQVVAKLASTGGTTDLVAPLFGRSWTVKVTLTMTVTPERMAVLREQLERFAAENGGVYEGWAIQESTG